MFTFQWKL